MKTLSEILNNIRKESLSEKDKGFRFERLMQAYLRTTSIYEGIFDNVWLWQDFPYKDQFGGIDTGIDLVAKTEEGAFWAIQCKCYAEDKYITKPDVDTFLSTSGKSFDTDQGSIHFSQRLWISTTNKWNSTAELSIKNQTPPVTRLNLIELENDNVDWYKLEQGIYGKTSRPAPFSIMEHQKKAIEKTHEYFKNHERGKLIMACGYVGDTKKKAEENEAVLCSMDDTNIYGEEIYKIGFGEAVEKELHLLKKRKIEKLK